MEENMRFVNMTKTVSVMAMMVLLAGLAAGQNKHCTAAGGMLMTNLGAVDPVTTMGTATGDLKGAVGATILSTEGSGNTLAQPDSDCPPPHPCQTPPPSSPSHLPPTTPP